MSKIRILIADDHGILRAGLCMLINSQNDMEVIGQAATNHEAVREACRLDPDLVIQDLNLPDGSGIQTITRLRRECPRCHVLVLTVHDEAAYARAALAAAGATGYVAKTAADTVLLTAIRAVHSNRVFVDLKSDVEELQRVLVGPADSSASASPGVEALSGREREVLGLLAQGHTNQEAADRLYLSVKTVETYRARIAVKLGLRRRADFIRYAVETGLLGPSGAPVLPSSRLAGQVSPDKPDRASGSEPTAPGKEGGSARLPLLSPES
jgi:two-component system, NarL family, response regulator NreC